MTRKIADDDEFIAWAVKGNPEAIWVCEAVMWMTQIWDDLIDEDRPVTKKDINDVFHFLLVELPKSRFYTDNVYTLSAVLNVGISDYIASNELVKGTEEQQRAAAIMRNNYSNFISQCAYIIGGFDWMNEVNLAVATRVHDEDFNAYLRSAL